MAGNSSDNPVTEMQQRLQQLELQVQQGQATVTSLQQENARLQAGQATVANLQEENAHLQARIKPPQPPPMFDGTDKQIRDLDMWVLQVWNYLYASGIRNEQLAIQHAVTLFGPVPLRWWQALAPNMGDRPFATWHEFVVGMKLAFPCSLVAAEARQRLYTMKQRSGQSFPSYLAAFHAVASRIVDLGTPEKMHGFLMGMLPDVRKELVRLEPPTFEAQVHIAAKVAASQLMERHDKSAETHIPRRQDTTVPMELGQLTAKQQKQNKQRRRDQGQGQGQGPPTFGLDPPALVKHRAEGRCYFCHATGHMWRHCPKRRKAPNGQ